jgi:hypothetical protein
MHMKIAWPLFFAAFCAYVFWQWLRPLKSLREAMPRWRANTALAGLCFATFSTVLSAFLYVHAFFTGGFPFYHPVELFCIRYGFLSALLGLIASLVGKGSLRPHVALASFLNLFLWFADAMAQ